MKKVWKCAASIFAAAVLMLSCMLAGCTDTDGELGALQAIYIVEEGLKTTYNVGDTFNYGAVKINAVYEEGEETISGTSEGVTHTTLDMSKAGKQELTFTYKEKSDSVEITILEVVDTLESLTFGAFRTAYTVGETFDYDSVPLVAHYTTRNVELTGASAGVTHNTLDMSKEGGQTLTYTYEGKSASTTITISAAPVEKKLDRIEIVAADPANLVYTRGDVIDYSVFSLKLYFTTGETESLALSADGVSYTPVDTASEGEKTLTVKYEGKEASITLTVNPPEVTVMSFDLPTSYENYMNDYAKAPAPETREDSTHLLAAAGTYRVGDDNGFRFIPAARGFVGNSKEPTVVTPKTTFTLSLQGEGADAAFTEVGEEDLATYVTTVEGKADIYFFQEAAVGKTFKLAVSLAEGVKTSGSINATTIEAVITIVDGYNVYDDIGLSVFDNLNVNHWKEFKTAQGTLAWDLKPLVEYNDLSKGEIVRQIVLHDTITIDPDHLPATYFWDEAREGQKADFQSVTQQLNNEGETQTYAALLQGSLRDYDGSDSNRALNFNNAVEGDVKEAYDARSVNMQKGLYNNVGTDISGNGMLITYVNPKESTAARKLWSVRDDRLDPSSNPVGHWSIFKYADEGIITDVYPDLKEAEGYKFSTNPRIESLRIMGFMPRLAETGGELPQLMAFNNVMDSLNLINCLISQVYVVIVGDVARGTPSAVNTKDTKALDVYSNMFYVWRSDVHVQNCVMKDAGGPIFLLSDGEYTGTDGKRNDAEGPHLYFDEASTLESKAAGTEPWYKLNNADALFSGIKMLNAVSKGYLNRTMTSTENGIEVVNVIAALICSPGELMNTEDHISVRGFIKRGETETYAMNPSSGNSFTDSLYYTPLIDSAAPIFFSNQIFAAYVQGALKNMGYPGDMLAKTAERFTSDAAQIRTSWDADANEFIFLTLRASALGPSPSAAAPRFGVLIGNCYKVQ